MDRDELFKELGLSYDELVNYLLQKYGAAKVDYYCNETMQTKNKKVTRTSEGLLCHHIDEDKGGNLSNIPQALHQPFRWQKSDRLVYCNYLEHLILHIKIAILRQRKRLYAPKDIIAFFTTGGIDMICKEINDIFEQNGTSVKWKQRCFECIKDNKKDYIMLLQALFYYIDKQYLGQRSNNNFFTIGKRVQFSDVDGEIIKISKSKRKILINTRNGENFPCTSHIFVSQFTFNDTLEYKMRSLSNGFQDYYDSIYSEITQSYDETIINDCYRLLLIDFHGYGFPQFTDKQIDFSIYGASNIDEYLSKAYPPTVTPKYQVGNHTPLFWRGNIPEFVEKNRYHYIVRIETMFDLKSGEEPFVRYKEHDYTRIPSTANLTEENNLLKKSGILLSTSDIFDRKTAKKYAQIRDLDGNIVDATVKLSLTKEDFALFKEKYSIRKMIILDGCYFIN